MSFLACSITTGLLTKTKWLLMKLLLFCCVISMMEAKVSNDIHKTSSRSPVEVPIAASAMLPTYLPFFHRPWQKHFSLIHASPAHPPFYGHMIASGNPLVSSLLSKTLIRSGSIPPFAGFRNLHPMQSNAGTLPPGFAQPPLLSPSVSHCCKLNMVHKRGSPTCHCVYPIKIDLLLLNVSQYHNWNPFLDQLAAQLGLRVTQIELINFYVMGLSRLNISMDITPHTGISFLPSETSRINSSLAMHKVNLDPKLVGNYKLLNITWFFPPPPFHAPQIAASPAITPPHWSTTSSSINISNKERHLNLILILGISAGVLFVVIISLFILCFCTFCEEKIKASSIVTEKQGYTSTVTVGGSLPHPSSTRFLAYEELKEATNNFEAASILGEGGFGRVFKGVLNDGTAVAIKRLTNGGQQGDKEFLVEVEMLSRLHHRNLVKLVGYYSSRDSLQNLLCYELVPNGSLEGLASWSHGGQLSSGLGHQNEDST